MQNQIKIIKEKQKQITHSATQFKEILQIHSKYFQAANKKCLFQQIDHGPSQLCPDNFSIQQNCLVINFDAFDKYYPLLFNIVKSQQNEISLFSADILLVMNGQNDMAWNLKKSFLKKKNTITKEYYLNLDYQLTLNQAVCLKCKKSSSYYEYRLRLIEQKLNQICLKNKGQKILYQIQILHQSQNKLLSRVLQRFFRNYFCWMYRIKLIKLIYDKLSSDNIQKQIIQQFLLNQLEKIHKFLQKYCNDYSGYSYLINFVKRYILINKKLICILKKDQKWIKQMNEYCEAVYSQKQNYKHFLMYQNFALNLQENNQ